MPSATENTKAQSSGRPARPRYRAVIGPKLKVLLICLFALFALLVVNSVYLVALRIMGLSTGESYENWFYLIMFLAHLIMGLALLIPLILFGIGSLLKLTTLFLWLWFGILRITAVISLG